MIQEQQTEEEILRKVRHFFFRPKPRLRIEGDPAKCTLYGAFVWITLTHLSLLGSFFNPAWLAATSNPSYGVTEVGQVDGKQGAAAKQKSKQQDTRLGESIFQRERA